MLSVLLGATAFGAPSIHVGYHGHLVTHPGLAARVAWNRPVEGWAIQPEAELGAWVHPRNQLATYLRGGAAIAHRGSKGGTHDLFVHLGGQRSTFLVPTYELDDGAPTTAVLAGQWWATATVGVGLGRDRWFVRPQLTLRAPHFHAVGTDVAVQVGARLGGGR